MTAPLSAVFMGTPEFAAEILRRALACPAVKITAVYSQPDRPAGRGKALKAPAVKELALELGLPVYQPVNFKDQADVDTLAALRPDVLLVAAYGLILPQRVLDIPRLMPVNVHASLLPAYRGAAPIQRAIMDGRSVTGVTIMRMEAGLDTGPILLQRAVGIDINDTSGDLHQELAEEGGDLLCTAMTRLAAGTLNAIGQEDARSSHAPKIDKKEGRVDLRLPAQTLHAHIRGLSPRPGATLILQRPGKDDLPVLVEPGVFPLPADLPIHAANGLPQPPALPGTILGTHGTALLVACGDGVYAFDSLRPAGKKGMDGKAFAAGYLGKDTPGIFALPENAPAAAPLNTSGASTANTPGAAALPRTTP